MYRISAFADEASPKIQGQIDAMHRNGISLLEIRGVDGENISKITAAKAREVRSMLDAEGIKVWSMGSPIGKFHLEKAPFEEHLDDFKRVLEYADILGADKIRMFSFHPVPGLTEDQMYEVAVEHLSKLCDLTPDSIVLCHENEKKIFGETPENCLKILKALPKIRAVFDPANFVQCGVDTLKAWEMMKPYVEYVHIKDANEEGTVVPAGFGLGNIPTILKDYFSRGGEVMTLEPHLHLFAGLDKLEDGESLKPGVRTYRDNDEAFDAAVKALNDILAKI
jgi:sugar phosphate isomerase/epimerase